MPSPRLPATSILLLEPDVLLRLSLASVLEDAGCVVLQTGSGREALQILRHRPVGLMIVELLSPEIDGLQLLAEAQGKSIPLIALSRGGMLGSHNYLAMARCLGARRTLAKPFTTEQLLAAVLETLNEV